MAGYVYGGTKTAPPTPAICGSEKGLWRHQTANEPRCDKCREFANQKRRASYHATKHKPAQMKRLATIAKLEKAKKLFAAGASQKEVHRKTGLSRTTISRHFPGQGWTLKQAAEYTNALRNERSSGP